MMDKIFIALATCRRNGLLKKTLISLSQLIPLEAVQIEVCVGDNDPLGGAEDCVLSFGRELNYKLTYLHCPQPGIPQVRNALLTQALVSNGTALIFIDDDEIVEPTWLKVLWGYFAENRQRVQAVHGPILPLFTEEPPSWFPVDLYGRDFKLASGTKLQLAATGNILLDLAFLREKNLFFDERMALTGGSDTELFFRFTRSGGVIHWCNEARVYEHVPESRMTIKWLCRRSFRLGSSDMKFWSLNHSFLYTLFWGVRRSTWNFIKNTFCLFVVGKPKKYYVKHLILLVKSFGLLLGIFGYSYLEYSERHR